MATFFQLVKAKRPSSRGALFVIPETAKTLLEDLVDPLVVISIFCYSQPLQAAVWDALHPGSAFDQHRDSTDTTSSQGSLSPGIWASLSEPVIDENSGLPVRVLFLFTSGLFLPENREQQPSGQVDNGALSALERAALPLLALCSNELNITSETSDAALLDLERVTSTLKPLTKDLVSSDSQAQDQGSDPLGKQDRSFPDAQPRLVWRWCSPSTVSDMVEAESSSRPHGSAKGFPANPSLFSTPMGRILRQGRDPTRKDLTQDPQSTQLAQNILAAWFQTVEWYGAENSRSRKSQETRQTWNYYNAGLPKESLGVPASSNHAGRMDSILENTLRDLTIIDVEEGRRSTDRGISGLAGTTRSNSASRTTWVNELLTRTRQKTMVRSHRLRSTRLPNGLSLHAKIQAYLAHYETTCAPPPIPEEPQPIFDHSKMAQMREEITKERFLAFGAQAYNTVMNLQLERHPLPVSWHTLAMIHQAAQSKGLEEIERRAGLLSSLPRVLRDFRLKCLETAASIPGAGVGAISTTGIGNEGSETEIEVMMVPRGGLYWEYYAANSSALQTHHLSTLDECWHQHLKSRLVQSSAHASRVAPTGISSTSRGASSATLSVTSPIKTYSEFLLAVDQVRRSYLETCIPSPEAFSVLENLDEMQQAEAAIFKQSLTASSPTLPSATIANPGSAMPQGSSGAASGTKPAISGTDSLRKGDASQSDTGQGNASTGDIIPSTQRPAPVALEQQIAEILKSKRGDPSTGNSSEQPNATKQSDGERAQASTASATPSGSSKAATKEAENKAVVQFGWTLHLLHANTQQYAWIWSWLYSHEGSSGQNVVACDSKMYTASKWIILPAKDLVRSRKEWKVSYGDRVWMVSYWFSTRNAKMELPEYLPRARGYPCRHIIPYGETYVICKTCPADILCMRCFRASDHTDHTMYLQCSWGTSICVCGDHQKLKSDNALHCSLHSAESQRSYSRLALGKPCQVKFKAGEMVYQCKTCVTDGSEVAFLCVRCFRSQNHFGHETVASISEEGASCSCHDGKSWKSTVRCMYHNVPQPLLIKPPEILTPPSFRPSHRCGHIFTPGEDIYHCRDCSVNKFVVLCSRCFHGSSCMNHNWKMGVFQKTDSTEQRFLTGGSSDNDITGSQASPKIQEITEDAEDSQEPKQEPYDASVVATCDCGDATLFKNAFDCNYHLPEEFRPVPHLVHCNYLFSREDPMFRCKTCHQFEHGNEDVWICERCFDTEEHQGHDIEESKNIWNEGLYCHCGDPSVTKSSHSAALTPHDASTGRAASSSSPTATGTIECKDDHNRQNQLCAKEIKEGERYYSCKTCQTSSSRVLCEQCFVKDAHEEHDYLQLCVSSDGESGSEPIRCGCGENSAFRYATHCSQHEREGGTNVVYRCRYRAVAGEWIAICRDCFPPDATTMGGSIPYLCQRCRQASDHENHAIEWIKTERDMKNSCACGSYSRPACSQDASGCFVSQPTPSTPTSALPEGDDLSSPPSPVWPHKRHRSTLPLCQYHTMIYKTSPSTTLYLHSHNRRSINHADHNEVTGYKYHDSDNDWIVTKPDGQSDPDHEVVDAKGDGQGVDAGPSQPSRPGPSNSQYLQWKDVFWLRHANTGNFLHSMASLKISQGFQEVTAYDQPHSNNDWIIEETTWLRQQILSDE